MSVSKFGRSSRRTRRSLSSTTDSLGPYIYCVNFHDNGLSAVRDEFIKRVISGTRRAIFVIDLEKEITEANFQLHRKSKARKTAQLKNLTSGAAKKKGNPDTKRAENTARPKTGKSSDKVRLEKIKCVNITAKEHNKVGKGVPMSKREYIRDNPLFTKILILIVGQMDNDFYKMLLAYEQPLRAIIHFMPEESAYDILVPRPRREQKLQETLAVIQRDIHSLRKRIPSKKVGIFQQQLPQMSSCLAAKFTDDVFDQLSWYMYDVETLREWYRTYYEEPYVETNVRMDPTLSLLDAFHVVESLSIQGHYLQAQMPACLDDDTTVYLYVESLMSTFGNPRELMSETEVLLLANPTPSVQTRILDKVKVYANSFKSIVKLNKNDRIFVEQENRLLSNLLSYMNQGMMRNVYHGCLEYNILRRYFTSGYINNALKCNPFNGEVEPIFLPKFAELYLTDDSVMQRIIQLVKDYDDFTLEEIQPDVHLYTFNRALNEVFEQENQTVIPTCLCFRDFTLFEMERFLEDLVTPQKFNQITDSHLSRETQSADIILGNDPVNVKCSDDNDRVAIDPKVFVRPKSIKGQQAKKKEKLDQDEARSISQKPSVIARENQSMASRHLRQSRKSLISNLQLKDSGFESKQESNLFVGLGPHHPMLEGYNLDDTRQTIKSKTSKYFFEEGRIVLYEEKWNFRQMNKCLALEIGGQEVHFRSADDPLGVTAADSGVRIVSKNGISLRAINKEIECAKVVLNYPNGLSTYCHDTHTEHLWQYQDNELNESRRVCTPYGCVIVFYQNTDTILIMRYNGEVYYLFSFTEADNEEEEEQNSDFINACSTQSGYSSYKPIKESKRGRRSCQNSKNSVEMVSLARSSGGGDSSVRPSNQSVKISKASIFSKKKRQSAALFESIKFELTYLNFIMALYKLSYRHLKLTTSLGSVVHVQRDGKIWCGKPFRNTEWHDYYANESYSMRDDGVKMIWTLGELKCYHSDGTVITSGTIESWDPGADADEFDIQISSSSSHANAMDNGIIGRTDTIFINDPNGLPFTDVSLSSTIDGESGRNSLLGKNLSSKGDMMPEEEEGEIIFEKSYITYMPNSYSIHHKIYAGIHFSFSHLTDVDLHLETSITTCDNMLVRVFKDQIRTDLKYSESPMEMPSSEADPDDWTRRRSSKQQEQVSISDETLPSGEEHKMEDLPILEETCIEVICNNLALLLFEDRVNIQTQLRKFGCDENAKCDLQVRDDIELTVYFAQSLSTTFRNWVSEVTSFINCFCPKRRTLYFLETINSSCQRKGFEMIKSVPPLGKYSFSAGNYCIDVKELSSVDNNMHNKYDWFDTDMKKFPRFRDGKKETPQSEFPMVLNTRIYVEVPAQLANTDRIHKFVSEFDTTKFRKQRYRFNEAILYHLYPRLQQLVHQEISKRSWKNRHSEHRRRMFIEQQRISLYLAMLKHKVYPNYFQFKDQFNSHVRNIEFFQFMASKCNEKEHPGEMFDDPVEDSSKPPTSKAKSKKNKCVCPKYLKSLD
ncbi:uncharacterized protein LOC108105724 [Drosophila eugracilis]|uniref:uncharacterized protein LOC108105724 n=1 Tax=Drosophila eugracilis TaxID=29029 RepID=UPI001BDAF789|nr:uncharacterized protein LOC108105724 [Drosophila eugracilis]